MIKFRTWDSAYFSIEVEGLEKTNPLYEDINKQVISFSVNEQNGKLINGTITFQEDKNQMMSTLIKMGRKLNITWGYKDNNILATDILQRVKNNPNELYSPVAPSRFIKAFIKSVSGKGDGSGKQEFTANFISFYPDAGFKTRPWNKDAQPGLTNSQIVNNIMTEMGLAPLVSFKRENDIANEYQDYQSNFRFLSLLSMKWGTIFRIGYTNTGQAVGLFCDYDNDTAIESFLNIVNTCIGVSLELEYKTGNANTKSYEWNHNAGETGGDNVQVSVVNGKPQIFRTVATTESVIVYKLNSDKIAKDLQTKGSVRKMTAFVSELLKIDTMKELVRKEYFIPFRETTAPQGIGLNMNVDTIGNPFYSPPARVKFGNGFPDLFRSGDGKNLIYYLVKVTHKIDRSGYTCSLQVQDAFSLAGGSLVGF